jgi:hypothetical protein
MRSPHDALRTAHKAIMTARVNWIVDADIRNFFGQVDHGWLIRMLELRIADPRILRLIRERLRAGALDGRRCAHGNRGGYASRGGDDALNAKLAASGVDCTAYVVQSSAPTRPIRRVMMGPSLLAYILVSKFDDQLPLYRLGEILARLGPGIAKHLG